MRATPIILIVEDEEIWAEVLSDILKSAEFNVNIHVTNTYQSAVVAFEQLKPDLVLLDLGLPPDSEMLIGVKLLKAFLRAHPTPPVIVVSGTVTSAREVTKVLSLGASAFFPKSNLDEREFVLCIRKLLTQPIRNAKELAISDKTASQGERHNSRDPLMSVIAEIVGGMCHDLSNSLAAASMMLKARRSPRCEYTQSAQSVITRANEAVEEMHQFVRQYYRNRSEPQRYVAANDFKETLKKMIEAARDDSTIRLSVSVSGLGEGFSMPSVLLRSVTVPLVRNATEAIAHPSVTSASGRIRVAVSSLTPDDGLRIVVTDNGPGWKGKAKDFERKLRDGSRVSTKGESRGYGLMNLFKVVSRLGGELYLGDNRKRGARVEVRLPWRSPNAKAKRD